MADIDENDVNVMEQGDEYTEDSTDGVDDDEDEIEEDGKIDTIYGIPKRFVFIGAAVLLLLIVLIIVVKLHSSVSDEVIEEVPVTMPEEYPTYDENYDAFGDSNLTFDESEVEEIDVNSDMVTNTSIPELTDEQHEELRKLGYTADEITLILSNGIDYATMVKHAEELHDDESRESYKRMASHSSKEFRYIMAHSYFGQDYVKMSDDPMPNEVTSKIIIADYVKCPTYGLQPFLKCKITSTESIFVVVSPAVYHMLPDTGNVRVQIEVTHAYGNYYVTDASVIMDDSVTVPGINPDTNETLLDEGGKDVNIMDEVNKEKNADTVEKAKEQLRKELEEDLAKQQSEQQQQAEGTNNE